jgi:hypothetical protein
MDNFDFHPEFAEEVFYTPLSIIIVYERLLLQPQDLLWFAILISSNLIVHCFAYYIIEN